MKLVITGYNSYIGNHLQSYIQNTDDTFEIYQLDVVGDKWRSFDFTGYDVVVHVAAIVHRKDIESWDIYQKVNVDLPLEIAEKAKSQGVKQFVFLSSMAVYGIGKSLSDKDGEVSRRTELRPKSLYGKSKHYAEQKLVAMEDDNFKLAIVRPPNVYGPGCRGGYISTYCKIVSKLPAIPKAYTNVKQSILYIDNLSRFIYLLIVNQKKGIYTPQDNKTISAVELMECINESLNLNKKTSSFLGLFIYLVSFLSLVKKGYGGVSYRIEDSHQDEYDYIIVPCEEGIRRTVQNGN